MTLFDTAKRVLKALEESHQSDGSLIWVSPGATAIETLRNAIEDAEQLNESATHWIRHHKCEYAVQSCSIGLDVSVVHFVWGDLGGYAILETAPDVDNECQSVMVNLETAADCEALCKVLRVNPKQTRANGRDNGAPKNG